MPSRRKRHNGCLWPVCLRGVYAATVSVARLPGMVDKPYVHKSPEAHRLIHTFEESH